MRSTQTRSEGALRTPPLSVAQTLFAGIPYGGRHVASAGYTLLELMVVIAIVGLTLGVIAPALPRVSDDDGDAARAIVRLLAAARRLAIERGTVVVVELDLASGVYLVTAAPQDAGRPRVVREADLVSRPAIGLGGGHVLRFDALGRAAGDLSLRVGRSGFVVETDRWTGRSYVRR